MCAHNHTWSHTTPKPADHSPASNTDGNMIIVLFPCVIASLRNKVLLKQGANWSTPSSSSHMWLSFYFIILALVAGPASSSVTSHLRLPLHAKYCYHNIHFFKSYSKILLLLWCLEGYFSPLLGHASLESYRRDFLPFGEWGLFPKEHKNGVNVFFRAWLFYYITAHWFI